jgi:hypothetical protein
MPSGDTPNPAGGKTNGIGTLSRKRVRQILDGIRLLTEPREAE